jgi:hypothetical protein
MVKRFKRASRDILWYQMFEEIVNHDCYSVKQSKKIYQKIIFIIVKILLLSQNLIQIKKIFNYLLVKFLRVYCTEKCSRE